MEKLNKWISLLANIGVVFGLGLLAFEIRLNTQVLEDAKELSIAQAYQSRAEMFGEHLLQLRDSPYIDQMSINIDPKTVDDPEARRRLQNYLRFWMNFLDNMHYQYQHGFLDQEYYEGAVLGSMENIAPKWRAVGITETRKSFKEEVDRILAAAEEE